MRRPTPDSLPGVSGATVRSLMRKHRVTVREVAKFNDLTMKRVREVLQERRTVGLATDH